MEPKKYPSADINQKQGLLFSISLIMSLLMVITAFEWKFQTNEAVPRDFTGQRVEEILEIPVTEQPPPPPPKIQQPNIIEVPDEEEIMEQVEVVFDQEAIETLPEVIIHTEEPAKEETTDEIFLIVESPPEYKGGQDKLNRYFQENLMYPGPARRMGIEGRVFVSAVIEKDGSVSTVEVLKGIGGGCDEESVRLIQSLPKWMPAKQRGRPVRSRVVFPITFKL